jgi:DNA-binding transcriptional ArsR family regulator
VQHDSTLSAYGGGDPALLAFVKCHINSVAKWDALCVLADRVGVWHDVGDLAHALNMPKDKVAAALADLANDGVVEERRQGSASAVFRLPEDEPTTVVVERLFRAARRNQELRRIVVAHMLRGAVA